MDMRKADTRRKIQLGGLVIKAGLAEEAPAVILGALIAAARAIAAPGGDAARDGLRQEGERAFGEGAANV